MTIRKHRVGLNLALSNSKIKIDDLELNIPGNIDIYMENEHVYEPLYYRICFSIMETDWSIYGDYILRRGHRNICVDNISGSTILFSRCVIHSVDNNTIQCQTKLEFISYGNNKIIKKGKTTRMKAGKYWSYLDFGKVENDDVMKDGHRYFAVKSDITGRGFLIQHGLEDLIDYHDTYEGEEKIGITALADKFLSSARHVMTVNFRKQLKEKDIIKEIKELYPNKKGNLVSKFVYEANVDDIVAKLLHGEERTIIGRHYGKVNDLGYVQFIDMEVEKDDSKSYDNRIRLIDPKRINWMIVDNVKYMRK
jgi:hypothetical protein